MNETLQCNASSRGFRILMLCAGLMAIGACTTSPGTVSKGDKADPVILAVTWSAADTCAIDTITPDANICQRTHAEFCMPRSKWIEWQSTPARKYDVYFSPFNTGSFNAGNNGKAKGKIDDNAPYALYKYSIVAEGCNPETQVNDPHIRVDK